MSPGVILGVKVIDVTEVSDPLTESPYQDMDFEEGNVSTREHSGGCGCDRFLGDYSNADGDASAGQSA